MCVMTPPGAPCPEQRSLRLAWVKSHARELIAIAERLGAHRVCLCGSVVRGTDGPNSDVDFYIYGFDDGPLTEFGLGLDARERADQLVKEFRALAPYKVDVRGLPGWPLDPPFEATMRRDAIELDGLANATNAVGDPRDAAHE